MVAILLLTVFSVSAYGKSVVLKEAGTLSEVLGPHRLSIHELTVEGPINKADFQLMSEMSRLGLLRRIDLSRTHIVKSGEAYDEGEGVFPNGVFQNSLLEEITFGKLSYVSGGSFTGLRAVERITFNGYLGHIDAGSAFCQCPRLREVVFNGIVLTTGGPTLAYDCPLLERVTFNGVVVGTGIGEAIECPNFKGYITNAPVIWSSYENFIKRCKASDLDDKTLETLKDANQIADECLTGNNFLNQIRADVKYLLATAFAMKGGKEATIKLLGEAAEAGYKSIENFEYDPFWNFLRPDSRFQQVMDLMRDNQQKWREGLDYMQLLKKAAPYAKEERSLPTFTYADQGDENLVRVRQYFHLDSIAGAGDEIARMKNIMYWLHNEIEHDGNGGIPDVPRNAIDLYDACKQQQRGLNCRGLAIVLSELYLAMGWPARFVTCEPKAYDSDSDCHVICMVWSHDINKWIWMDPSFAAYVSDDEGKLLGIGEVRQRLINGRPLVLNEDANWNHNPITIDNYLYMYMAKNLYFLSTYEHSGFQTERGCGGLYITLSPAETDYRDSKTITHDDSYFYLEPGKLLNK